MKTLIAAGVLAIGAVFAVVPAIASAGTGLCSGHADYQDLPFGAGGGNQYITACGGDSGPDYSNTAQPPNVSTAVTGAQEPKQVQATGGIVDTGTYDDQQDVADDNGTQDAYTHGSQLFVPQGVA